MPEATLEIPGTPPSLNQVGYRSHWSVGRREKKKWEEMIGVALMVERVPRGLASVSASAEIHFRQRRRRDVGNFAALLDKALGDILQSAWGLPDDQFSKNPNCCLDKKARKRLYDQRRYREKRGEILERVAAWQRANPVKVNELSLRHKRRRRHGRDQASLEFGDILRQDPCGYCGALPGEIDHIEPISGGGLNHWSNLGSACRRCNASKRTRSVLIFMMDRL